MVLTTQSYNLSVYLDSVSVLIRNSIKHKHREREGYVVEKAFIIKWKIIICVRPEKLMIQVFVKYNDFLFLFKYYQCSRVAEGAPEDTVSRPQVCHTDQCPASRRHPVCLHQTTLSTVY